ncbi:UNVERIFIED_CONTAM: hypothetical protein RMT77_015827 [Armadillidium vulgare]
MLLPILLLLSCYDSLHGAYVKKSRTKYPFAKSRSSNPFSDYSFSPAVVGNDRGLLPLSKTESEKQTLDPKMGDIFKRLSLTFNKQKHDPREAECDDFGGTFVAPDCFEFVNFEVSFEEARHYCQHKGGDLWTPDPTDTFLFFKLGYAMPAFARANNEKVWVGYGVDETDPSIVLSIEDKDISGTLIAEVNHPSPHKVGECLVLNFDHAAFYSSSEDCSKDIEFICEYPLTPLAPMAPSEPWDIFKTFLNNLQQHPVI